MRTLCLVVLSALLASCGSIADRPGRSSAPTNPFASNYPSVDPGGMRREDGLAGRGERPSLRPPRAIPE